MNLEEFEIKFKHFNTICRFCLKRDFNLTQIFHDEIINFVSVDSVTNNENYISQEEQQLQQQKILNMIEIFTGIKMCLSDKLPKQICSNCLGELTECNKFRQKCLKSQDILESVLKLHEMKFEYKDSNSKQNVETVPNKIDRNSGNDNDNDDNGYENENNDSYDGGFDSETNNKDNNINDSIDIDDEIKFEPETSTKVECESEQDNFVENDEIIEKKEKASNIKIETKEQIKSKYQRVKFKGDKTTKSRSGQCQICGKMFQDLYHHIPRHTKNHKCQFCGKTSWTAKSLQRHIHRHHSEKDQFPCEFCNKICTSRRILKDHRASKHTKETNYECKECGKKFAVYSSYRKHMEIHSNEGPFTCDICEKVFQLKDSFQKHYRIHTAEKCHKCEFCGKGFIRLQTLTDHRRVHTKERPYVCSHCGSTFTQKSSLNLHTKKFHLNNDATNKNLIKVQKDVRYDND